MCYLLLVRAARATDKKSLYACNATLSADVDLLFPSVDFLQYVLQQKLFSLLGAVASSIHLWIFAANYTQQTERLARH